MYQPATQEQKTEMVKLSNSPQITPFEKTKVFRDLNKLSSERAAVMIARLKKWAGDRRPHIPSGSFKAPVFSAISSTKADTTAVVREFQERATEAEYERRSQDPSICQHCHGDGVSHDQPDGCSGCNGTGKTKRGYWNNYGRDWDYDD